MKAVDKLAQKLEALHNCVTELLQSNRASLPEQEQLTGAFDELYSALKELELAEQQLCQQNNERFRLLVEDVKDYAIFTLDPNGYINSWNLGAERILGYQEAEIIGQSGSCIFTPKDLQRGEDKKELSKALAEGRAEDERWHVRKDGTHFWASGVLTPLRDEAGNLLGFSKILRDFTERKQAEEALRQQAEELSQANRMKDEFLATLSHELRSPLNAILGWARLLGNRKFDAVTSARAIETIERNARSQLQLIEDLLDVSRIIRGQLHLNVRPLNLVPVIESAIDAVRPAADAKAIQLQAVLDPMAGQISGDADRLQQVIWNLLTNAIKFTPKAGRVQICLERINSHLEITVSDTGQGIAADFLPHVFDRFRQADSSITRTYSGLGLGLAIVRHLANCMGAPFVPRARARDRGQRLLCSCRFWKK